MLPGSLKWLWSKESRAGQAEKTDMQEEESHYWLPAKDNFQLATVELPSIRQAHDALLVARQV